VTETLPRLHPQAAITEQGHWASLAHRRLHPTRCTHEKHAQDLHTIRGDLVAKAIRQHFERVLGYSVLGDIAFTLRPTREVMNMIRP